MTRSFFFALIASAIILIPQVSLALLTGPSVGSTCCICVKDGVYVAEGAAFQSPDGFGAKCASESCQVEYSACTDQAVKDKINGLNTTVNSVTPLVTPTTQVVIPGLTFTKTLDLKDGANGLRFYEIPWIAEYISAVYRWGVGIAGVLAVVMIIIGGFTWLTAGGNSSQVETGKKYIIGALAGLVFVMSSYTILWLINPELVKLKSIAIPYVERLSLEIPESEPENIAAEKTGNLTAVGERKTTEFIVIHTAAGLQSRNEVDAFHRTKGWAGIGYNFYIERNGQWVEGRGESKVGAHAVGYNAKSIGISYAGCVNFQVANQPLATALAKETITQTQLDTLIEHIKQLQQKYNIPRNKVLDHRETGAPKACSCLNMDEIRAKINP